MSTPFQLARQKYERMHGHEPSVVRHQKDFSVVPEEPTPCDCHGAPECCGEYAEVIAEREARQGCCEWLGVFVAKYDEPILPEQITRTHNPRHPEYDAQARLMQESRDAAKARILAAFKRHERAMPTCPYGGDVAPAAVMNAARTHWTIYILCLDCEARFRQEMREA